MACFACLDMIKRMCQTSNGVSRGRMPLNKYRTDRFLFIKGQLVYSYDYNKIAFTNCIGKVTRTIDIGNYQFHHDFRYDKKHDKIICLVNNLDKDTIEDTIVQVDVKTGKTSMLFDCENWRSREKVVEIPMEELN